MLNSLKRVAIGTAGRLPLMLAVLAMAIFLASGGSRYITIAAISDNARWLRHTAESWVWLRLSCSSSSMLDC